MTIIDFACFNGRKHGPEILISFRSDNGEITTFRFERSATVAVLLSAVEIHIPMYKPVYYLYLYIKDPETGEILHDLTPLVGFQRKILLPAEKHPWIFRLGGLLDLLTKPAVSNEDGPKKLKNS